MPGRSQFVSNDPPGLVFCSQEAAALANELAGTDLNDVDGEDHDGDTLDADAEIIIVFNSSANWYYGVDANHLWVRRVL
jgi:hypothetical protein